MRCPPIHTSAQGDAFTFTTPAAGLSTESLVTFPDTGASGERFLIEARDDGAGA